MAVSVRALSRTGPQHPGTPYCSDRRSARQSSKCDHLPPLPLLRFLLWYFCFDCSSAFLRARIMLRVRPNFILVCLPRYSLGGSHQAGAGRFTPTRRPPTERAEPVTRFRTSEWCPMAVGPTGSLACAPSARLETGRTSRALTDQRFGNQWRTSGEPVIRHRFRGSIWGPRLAGNRGCFER